MQQGGGVDTAIATNPCFPRVASGGCGATTGIIPDALLTNRDSSLDKALTLAPVDATALLPKELAGCTKKAFCCFWKALKCTVMVAGSVSILPGLQ